MLALAAEDVAGVVLSAATTTVALLLEHGNPTVVNMCVYSRLG